MPAEFTTEALRMLAAGGIVAAAALPVGLAGYWVARRRSRPLLPAWKPWRVPWGGFEVAAAFLVVAAIVPDLVSLGLTRSGLLTHVYGPGFPWPAAPSPAVEASAVAGVPAATAAAADLEAAAVLRQLWTRTLALPLQLGLLFVAARSLYPAWKPGVAIGPAAGVALAVAAWAALTPVVLGFNFAVHSLLSLFDAEPESHQLTRFVGRAAFDPALFLFQVSVAAPVVEEVIFRGLVLAWVLGGRKPRPAPDVPPAARPWVVAGAGVMFAGLTGKVAPVVFAAALLAGLAVLVRAFRSKRRAAGAVYASAAFFAAVHSSVWPSPVPLFLLGLGLGWLAVRTRGVLVPVAVHGLFNAVSGVYVLRGGAG